MITGTAMGGRPNNKFERLPQQGCRLVRDFAAQVRWLLRMAVKVMLVSSVGKLATDSSGAGLRRGYSMPVGEFIDFGEGDLSFSNTYSVSGSASRFVGYVLGEGSELLGAVFLPVVVA